MIASGPLFLTNPRPRPHFRPRGPLLHVRFVPVASTWESGIHMPETMQVNTTEAEVIGVGPGRWWANGGGRAAPWPDVGDVCCFEPHMCRRIGPNDAGLGEDEGFVDCEAVVGLTTASDDFVPLSCWIKINPEPRPDESLGGVRLSDRIQRWRSSGTVRAVGPGYLHSEGPCAIRRETVEDILNWPKNRPLVGATVFWKKEARILQVGRDEVSFWLVRAGDVLCYAVEDGLAGDTSDMTDRP